MAFTKIPREFYQEDALSVTEGLLGAYLVHNTANGPIAGRIMETECYRGDNDKACHAYPFKKTKRTALFYGPGGFAYVYLIYGIYYCMNVIVEKEEMPCAVLIRRVDIVLGKDEAARRRYGLSFDEVPSKKIKTLSDGPGKLCIAMGITSAQNGADLQKDEFFIASHIDGIENRAFDVTQGPRVGIDYAEEARDFPWRFVAQEKGL